MITVDRLASLALAVITLVGCTATPSALSPSATPSAPIVAPLAADEYALPTMAPTNVPSGIPEGCAGIGLHATVAGDPADPRMVWLVPEDIGLRIDVVWPAGYRVRFAPRLEVLNAQDVVWLRAGDAVDGGCVVGQRLILLSPRFTELRPAPST